MKKIGLERRTAGGGRLRPAASAAGPLGSPLAARLMAALDAAEAGLAEANPARMIHEVRKALKDYRALLRLVPGEPAKAARRRAAAFARTLSGDRDTTAARDAVAALQEKDAIDTELGRACLDGLTRPSGSAETAPADHATAVRAFLKDARREHARRLDAQAAAADLVEGLATGYRKARAASDFSTPEAMHEARKRVVTHRYQMSFFSDLTDRGRGRAKKAQALRDILGLNQDLETLLERLPALGLPPERAARLKKATRRVQRDLSHAALKAHARLFARRPASFAKRLARHLRRAQQSSVAQSETP